VLVFAPRPVEHHDAASLSATVLSPTVDVSSRPAAARTAVGVVPLAVLVAGLAALVVARPRRHTAPEPVVRLDAAARRGRPPRRGPPTSLV
jgi:hypothetical protein